MTSINVFIFVWLSGNWSLIQKESKPRANLTEKLCFSSTARFYRSERMDVFSRASPDILILHTDHACCEYLRDTAISISLMVRSEPLKPITCRLLQLTLLAIKTILPPSKNSQPLGIKHTSLTTSTWQTLHHALKLSGLISGLQLVVCICLRALSFLSYFQLFISIIKKKEKEKEKMKTPKL